MIKRVLQYLVLVIAVVALPLACKRTETAVQGDGTQTIKPAATQSAETSTADMTQTVELQDGRSEAEGGVLSNPSTTGTSTTTTDLPPVTGTGTSTAPTTATTRTQ